MEPRETALGSSACPPAGAVDSTIRGADMLEAARLAQVPARDTDFFDRLYRDFLADDPFLVSRFPCSFRRVECPPELARRRRQRPPDPALWREVAEAHARWG